jgi:hypothetical protein
MSIHELQIRARDEWYGSRELQRAYATPEFYWWEKYQRVYCPECRADFTALRSARMPA